MNLYEFLSIVSGLIYSTLLWLLIFKPEFTFKYILFDADLEIYGTEENFAAMKAVFAMLMVLIAPAYLTAAFNGYTTYIDVSIFQRITVVFASAFITGRVIGQDISPTGGNFTYTMFFVGDVVPAIVQMIFAPGGFSGMKCELLSYFVIFLHMY